MLKVLILEIIKSIKAVLYKNIARIYYFLNYRGYYYKALTYSETLTRKLEIIKKKVSICLDYI
jgi:hypothetical protein